MTKKIQIMRDHGNALVIIDMQNDFALTNGALYVTGVPGEPTMDEIIARSVALAKMPFDWVAATTDEHPDGHKEFDIFGKHCVMNTLGAKLVEELDYISKDFDELVSKGAEPAVISYSVVTSENFEQHIKYLRNKGIERVFLCGLAYTHCVGESAIAYASQGFEVFVIRDATRSVPPPYGDPEKMNQKLALYGVKLINFSDIE